MNSLFDDDGSQGQQQYQQPPPQQQQWNNQGGAKQNSNYQHPHNSHQQNARYNSEYYKRYEGTMPFGKHKGVRISLLPVDYLVWLWWKRQGDPLRDPLRSHVASALSSNGIDPNGQMPEHFRNPPRNQYQGGQQQNQDYQNQQNYGGGNQWQQ